MKKNCTLFVLEIGKGILLSGADIVSSAKRIKIDASDLGMQDVELRDLILVLKNIQKLILYYLQVGIVKMDQNIFSENN